MAHRTGEVRLQNDYMPAFVAVLPISVRCEDQYRDQHGVPRPTALLALNMVDVLESQRLPTHELDPVVFYTILKKRVVTRRRTSRERPQIAGGILTGSWFARL